MLVPQARPLDLDPSSLERIERGRSGRVTIGERHHPVIAVVGIRSYTRQRVDRRQGKAVLSSVSGRHGGPRWRVLWARTCRRAPLSKAWETNAVNTVSRPGLRGAKETHTSTLLTANFIGRHSGNSESKYEGLPPSDAVSPAGTTSCRTRRLGGQLAGPPYRTSAKPEGAPGIRGLLSMPCHRRTAMQALSAPTTGGSARRVREDRSRPGPHPFSCAPAPPHRWQRRNTILHAPTHHPAIRRQSGPPPNWTLIRRSPRMRSRDRESLGIQRTGSPKAPFRGWDEPSEVIITEI
jgi:hypothetical protein